MKNLVETHSVKLNSERVQKLLQIKESISCRKPRGPSLGDALRYCIDQAQIPENKESNAA